MNDLAPEEDRPGPDAKRPDARYAAAPAEPDEPAVFPPPAHSSSAAAREPAEEVDLRPLAPAAVTVWRLKLGLFLAPLVLAAGAFDLVGLFRDGRALPPGLLVLLAAAALAALVVVGPALRYRYWRYRLGLEELFLQRGIFNRVRTIVPIRRIQHLDVSQDLIEREYGIARLVVHTAGTRSSDVVLPGLAVETAEHLRDEMKRTILEDAV